jgi:hypothetical protein
VSWRGKEGSRLGETEGGPGQRKAGRQERRHQVAATPHTYMLNEEWTSGIKDALVGIKHLPAVHLELDITQVWVIDHGAEVGNQQPKGELQPDQRKRCQLPLSLLF